MATQKEKKPRNKHRASITQDVGLEQKGSIPSDVLGSYTGTPADGERPTQDADDL